MDRISVTNLAAGNAGRGTLVDHVWLLEIEIPVADVETNVVRDFWNRLLARQGVGTARQDFPGGIALERNVNRLRLAFGRRLTGGITTRRRTP